MQNGTGSPEQSRAEPAALQSPAEAPGAGAIAVRVKPTSTLTTGCRGLSTPLQHIKESSRLRRESTPDLARMRAGSAPQLSAISES